MSLKLATRLAQLGIGPRPRTRSTINAVNHVVYVVYHSRSELPLSVTSPSDVCMIEVVSNILIPHGHQNHVSLLLQDDNRSIHSAATTVMPSKLPGEDLALCPTCGTQYDVPLDKHPSKCTICEVGLFQFSKLPSSPEAKCSSICQLPQRSENAHLPQDPRQYVPAAGQTWTSLRKERGKHKNEWKQDAVDERIWSIYTDPKVHSIPLRSVTANVSM